LDLVIEQSLPATATNAGHYSAIVEIHPPLFILR
jgi:hypothetical protein